MQRRLRHEPWRRPMMSLGSMNEKRMAQVDSTGLAGRQSLRSIGPHLVQHEVRHASLSGRSKKPCHVEMRSHAYPRRCIQFAYIGEQEQHQQGAITRGDVHAPGGKIPLFVWIARLAGKADIDMPAASPGSSELGKRTGKVPRFGARTPTSFSDELVEGRMENRTVYGPLERLVTVVTKLDDRLFDVAGSSGSHGRSRQRMARPSSASCRGKARSILTNPS